jgi:hypothetical protein
MPPSVSHVFDRMQERFGARLGRPAVGHGVVALPTALAATPENLAALEAAWRFDSAPVDSEARRER